MNVVCGLQHPKVYYQSNQCQKMQREILKCKSRSQGHSEETIHWSESSLHLKVHYVHVLLQLSFILPQIVQYAFHLPYDARSNMSKRHFTMTVAKRPQKNRINSSKNPTTGVGEKNRTGSIDMKLDFVSSLPTSRCVQLQRIYTCSYIRISQTRVCVRDIDGILGDLG